MSKKTLTYGAIAIAAIILFPVQYFFFKDDPDNPVEELEEYLIEELTGIEIDLSKDTPE